MKKYIRVLWLPWEDKYYSCVRSLDVGRRSGVHLVTEKLLLQHFWVIE